MDECRAIGMAHDMGDAMTTTALRETTTTPSQMPLECTATAALDQMRAGQARLIDIRQTFELALKGPLPDALHLPFFNFKQQLGLGLDEEEQEILDADTPSAEDKQRFLRNIDKLQHHRDATLLLVCNSGRRSLVAVHLLREMGYPRTCSVFGGMHALLSLLQPQG